MHEARERGIRLRICGQIIRCSGKGIADLRFSFLAVTGMTQT
jgi:hypothetical protein